MTYNVFSGTLNPAPSQSFPGQPASAGFRSLSSYPCSAREALGYMTCFKEPDPLPVTQPTVSKHGRRQNNTDYKQGKITHKPRPFLVQHRTSGEGEDSLLDIYTSCLTTVPLANYSIS